jgi:hypothetical protein
MVDAAWLFGKEDHSDAQLVIVEEEEEGAAGDNQAAATGGERAKRARTRTRKRGRAESSSEGQVVLPIHKTIVMSASEFFKARLHAWQSDAEPCRVVLHVPPGQVEIGRRLVRVMYEAKPSFDDQGLEQKVQLLRLADRYGAPTVVEAVAAAAGFDAAVMAEKGLAWATVLAAYSKDSEDSDYYSKDPEASAPPQLPASPLRRYADDALQELFGDLEAVWAAADDGEKQCDLLELHFAALKALLADRRTSVASENTVVHTIVRWVAKNKLAPSSAQVKKLLALVRVARLTPHYARTVFCESAPLVKAHLSTGELAVASMLPLADCALYDFPSGTGHWRRPARPRSTLADAVVLEWCPRLSELEACFTSLPAQGKGRSSVVGPKGVVWQGWPLYLKMDSERTASGDLMLEPSLAVELPCKTAGALIEFALEAVAAGGRSVTARTPKPCLVTIDSTSWGWENFFGLDKAGGGAGPPKDWAGVEAALRAQRLVHGDGGAAHLKLRCKVTRLE